MNTHTEGGGRESVCVGARAPIRWLTPHMSAVAGTGPAPGPGAGD